MTDNARLIISMIEMGGFNEEVHLIPAAYFKPERFYHNADHINEMLSYITLYNDIHKCFNEVDITLLQLAVIFHDIVYDPLSKINEEQSAAEFLTAVDELRYIQNYNFATSHEEKVVELIMATKQHNFSHEADHLTKAIILADLDRFCNPEFSQVWQYTVQLFKEYAPVDFADFMKGRIEFLEGYKFKLAEFLPEPAYENIDKIITAMEIWEPKIAVYPGTFNPFHRGHLNILEKGLRIFDKVIIAVGQNPKKPTGEAVIPDSIRRRFQVDKYNGLLTDYIDSKEYPITVIRGLRNNTDLSNEINQYRWLQELDSEINVVSLFCDKEFEHVSSTSINIINQFGKKSNYVEFE
jgi:pantetheine-phosphate adenylyltransferase